MTILFLDIVGYTTLSSSLTAEKVLFLLQRFFARLDDLCAELGVFKVETIGASEDPAAAT